MLFDEKIEIIDGSEIIFQIITLEDSYYIYIGDKNKIMSNLFYGIQTKYVYFYNSILKK